MIFQAASAADSLVADAFVAGSIVADLFDVGSFDADSFVADALAYPKKPSFRTSDKTKHFPAAGFRIFDRTYTLPLVYCLSIADAHPSPGRATAA